MQINLRYFTCKCEFCSQYKCVSTVKYFADTMWTKKRKDKGSRRFFALMAKTRRRIMLTIFLHPMIDFPFFKYWIILFPLFLSHTFTELRRFFFILMLSWSLKSNFSVLRAQNMPFWPVESDFYVQFTLENLYVNYTFTLGSGLEHNLGTIFETIKNPASEHSLL